MVRIEGFVKGLFATVLLSASASAGAATVPLSPSPSGPTLGVGDVGTFVNFVSPGGGADDVADKWYFQLAGPSGVGVAVDQVVLDLTMLPGLEVSFASLGLNLCTVDCLGANLLGSVMAGSTLSLASLAGGSYYLDVFGDVNGTLGGQYTGAVSVSAVPVPAALWLMLSGLVGLGVVARRRIGKDGATALAT